MTEARETQIVRKLREENGLTPDQPSPYYRGDRGWSWDREQRMHTITEALNADRYIAKPPRPHSKETLTMLKELIEEAEKATRDNLETHAGMTWLEQSKLCQGLLYSWFKATRENF